MSEGTEKRGTAKTVLLAILGIAVPCGYSGRSRATWKARSRLIA